MNTTKIIHPFRCYDRSENTIALICTFLWIGFVCAISFMEAWLKFRAPGINLALGLGIGRIVFSALNKVEWVFALVIIIHILWNTSEILKWQNLSFVVPLILLLIQTFWLLPALDARAELHILNLPQFIGQQN